MRSSWRIDRILQEFSERIGQVADATRDSFAALLQLDLLFAKSRLADKMKATVPGPQRGRHH